MRANPPSMSQPDELLIYGMLVLIGVIPVVIALVRRETFGVDASLGLLMVCAGGIGAIGAIEAAWRARG